MGVKRKLDFVRNRYIALAGVQLKHWSNGPSLSRQVQNCGKLKKAGEELNENGLYEVAPEFWTCRYAYRGALVLRTPALKDLLSQYDGEK